MNAHQLKTSLVFWLVGLAHAQTVPDAGTLFRQAEQNLPMNRQVAPLITLTPPPLGPQPRARRREKSCFSGFQAQWQKAIERRSTTSRAGNIQTTRNSLQRSSPHSRRRGKRIPAKRLDREGVPAKARPCRWRIDYPNS